MDKKRITLFALAVFVIPLVFDAVLGGLLGWRPTLFGKAGELFRWIDRVVSTGIYLLLYVWLLRPIANKRLLHALCVFCIVEVLVFASGVAVQGSISQAFVWQASATHLAIALVSVGIATLIWRPSKAPLAHPNQV